MEKDAEYLRRMLDETNAEVARTDVKASIIFAGASIVVGSVISGLVAGDVDVARQPSLVVFLAAVGFLSGIAGFVSLTAAIYPRLQEVSSGRARYFAEIASFEDDEAAGRALREEAHHEAKRDIEQLYLLSKLVASKYRDIRRGILLLSSGFILCAVAAVAGSRF